MIAKIIKIVLNYLQMFNLKSRSTDIQRHRVENNEEKKMIIKILKR